MERGHTSKGVGREERGEEEGGGVNSLARKVKVSRINTAAVH